MKEPEKPKHPGSSGMIEESLRNNGEPRTSVASDLEALEAALLAEIEAFDLRAFTPGSEAAQGESDLQGKYARSQPIPEIRPEMIQTPPEPEEAAPVQPAPASKASSPAAGGAGLLAQLRRQAEALQQDESARRKDLEDLCRQLDAALRRIFSYCHDLVQQLNVLHPPVDRQYAMLGGLNFSGLEWQKGFVDYRTRPDSAGTLYEYVTMACHLARPDRLRQERDAVSADNFRKTLLDNGISFTYDEIRKDRRTIEKVIFSVAAEIKINLRWRGDLDARAIILECRNLERFGAVSYVIPFDAVKPVMLDEFGRLLLGQPHRFRDYCGSPISPLAYKR